jgi:hypothetical protein
LGAALGAVLAVLAPPSSAEGPSRTFRTVVIGAVVVGSLLMVIWSTIGIREGRVERSPALDLVFEGEGTPCLHRSLTRRPVMTDIPAVTEDLPITSFTLAPLPLVQTSLIRLRVRNLRARPLERVTVQLRGFGGLETNLPAPALLQWMHDDGPEHLLSIQGRVIKPGEDEDAYIDVLSKDDIADVFGLEFAASNRLYICRSSVAPLDLELGATGYDEVTHHRVPDLRQVFRLTFDWSGRPTLRKC